MWMASTWTLSRRWPSRCGGASSSSWPTEELCVCHLVEELDVPQPLVSHHLQVLRDAGLVDSERFRYWTYYRLRTEALADLGHSLGALADAAPPAVTVDDRVADADDHDARPQGHRRGVGTGAARRRRGRVGIFAQRLSPDDVGLQLLENSTATAGGLVALILAFGSVSGAHFNPVVSLADRIFGGLTTRELAAYVPAQIAGACVGAIVANLMFDLDAVTVSTHARDASGLLLGEVVATFGLLIVILGVVRSGRAATAPFAVAGLHRRRVLVHLFHQLRQPGRHHRPHPHRHLRRHRAVVRARVHRRAAPRRHPRRRARPLPLPRPPGVDVVVPHEHAEAA